MFTYTVYGIDLRDNSDGEVVLLTAQSGGQENLPTEQVVPPSEMAGALACSAGGLAAGVIRCEVTCDGVAVGEFQFYRGWMAA